MRFAEFKGRMLAGEYLAGTFLKTPAYELVEVLASSGLDFLCLDAEHAPFDRARMDFPTLVRPASASPEASLQALDAGAVGIVAPHVDSAEKAQALARAGHYGLGGRGFAGATRSAGFATRKMGDVLGDSQSTVLIAQIEEPAGVDAVDEIAAVPGIDGLFVGPADLSVGYGKTDQSSEELRAAYARCGAAAKAAGKAYMTFVGSAAQAEALLPHGLTTFFIASEHNWMRQVARDEAQGIKSLPKSG